MYSRNENDITVAWPELSTPPLGGRDLLVDGEIIALNEHGLPDFRMLQDRMHLRNAQTAAPAGRRPSRRRTWSSTCSASTARTSPAAAGSSAGRGSRGSALDSTWQVPAVYDDGPMLFDATLQQGLEGVVSKRRSSKYVVRPPDRLVAQARAPLNASFVVGRLAAAGGHDRRQPGRRCWSAR